MLNEIRFKNFKCFGEADINLSKLTVLAGLNGMGKSTVIQAILALRQSCFGGKIENGLMLDGRHVNLGNGKDVFYEKAIDDYISITLCEEKEVEYKFAYDSNALVLPIEKKVDNVSDILSSHQFIYLSADRIIPSKSYKIGNEKDVDNRDFGNNGEFALQYINKHGDESTNPDTSLNLEIEKWMAEISPGVLPVIRVNPEQQAAELHFKFREGNDTTNEYKALNVGFGLTYVLPVVAALLTASNGDYILIENPEAHIHPRGQRKLGELIAFAVKNGAQVILETHSDHIINGIRLSVKRGFLTKQDVEFVYFYRHVTTYEHMCLYPKIDERGNFNEWPEGFFDEWENSMMELL